MAPQTFPTSDSDGFCWLSAAAAAETCPKIGIFGLDVLACLQVLFMIFKEEGQKIVPFQNEQGPSLTWYLRCTNKNDCHIYIYMHLCTRTHTVKTPSTVDPQTFPTSDSDGFCWLSASAAAETCPKIGILSLDVLACLQVFHEIYRHIYIYMCANCSLNTIGCGPQRAPPLIVSAWDRQTQVRPVQRSAFKVWMFFKVYRCFYNTNLNNIYK